VEISVATTPDSVEITGTGTAYDGTYINNGNNDSFGNPVLENGTNSLIKDSTNVYWCLESGITTVNPDFNASQWWNQTGSIEGSYTAVLGVGGTGTGTISAGSEGGDALTTNSTINTPSLSIMGKALRTWNAIGDYIVDSIVEPATGAAYAFMANGIPRWAIPVGGAGLGAQLYRSVFLGGYDVDSENPNNDTDVANLAFDETFIDCNTGTTGNEAKPDLGVAGAAQIKDGILVGESQSTGDRTTMLPTGFFKSGVEVGWKTVYDDTPSNQFDFIIFAEVENVQGANLSEIFGKLRVTWYTNTGAFAQKTLIDFSNAGISPNAIRLQGVGFELGNTFTVQGIGTIFFFYNNTDDTFSISTVGQNHIASGGNSRVVVEMQDYSNNINIVDKVLNQGDSLIQLSNMTGEEGLVNPAMSGAVIADDIATILAEDKAPVSVEAMESYTTLLGQETKTYSLATDFSPSSGTGVKLWKDGSVSVDVVASYAGGAISSGAVNVITSIAGLSGNYALESCYFQFGGDKFIVNADITSLGVITLYGNELTGKTSFTIIIKIKFNKIV